MKDKLKAIWRILRAKSYFYTVHVGDSFVSSHKIGNQPKTPLPAHVRVDVMFAEVDKLAIIARDHIKRMVTRYHHPQFIDEEPWESNSCPDCKNWEQWLVLIVLSVSHCHHILISPLKQKRNKVKDSSVIHHLNLPVSIFATINNNK